METPIYIYIYSDSFLISSILGEVHIIPVVQPCSAFSAQDLDPKTHAQSGARMRIAFQRFSEENDLYRGQVHEARSLRAVAVIWWLIHEVSVKFAWKGVIPQSMDLADFFGFSGVKLVIQKMAKSFGSGRWSEARGVIESQKWPTSLVCEIWINIVYLWYSPKQKWLDRQGPTFHQHVPFCLHVFLGDCHVFSICLVGDLKKFGSTIKCRMLLWKFVLLIIQRRSWIVD